MVYGLPSENLASWRLHHQSIFLVQECVREGYLRLKNISDFLNQSILLVHECVREGYLRLKNISDFFNQSILLVHECVRKRYLCEKIPQKVFAFFYNNFDKFLLIFKYFFFLIKFFCKKVKSFWKNVQIFFFLQSILLVHRTRAILFLIYIDELQRCLKGSSSGSLVCLPYKRLWVTSRIKN